MLTRATLSAQTLASVLEQSVDCVKLITHDGAILWMNPNGQCAMEIDDFQAVEGRQWAQLWPEETRKQITSALKRAATGEVVRFKAFCPTAKGQNKYWEVCVSSVSNVEGQHFGYLSVSRDITLSHEAEQALETAAAEMRHRLRNTYMMISSLLRGFARGNAAQEAFADEMSDRLQAISRAQSLLHGNGEICSLRELVATLLEPFDGPNCTVTIGSLPGILVTQGVADAIALVLGELAVNSGKHGALAFGGSIALSATNDENSFVLRWAETSRERVKNHSRPEGQGLVLIDRIVTLRRGKLTFDWADYGPTIEICFPHE